MHPKDAVRMANSADPDQEQSDLVYTVCSGLCVRKLWNITVMSLGLQDNHAHNYIMDFPVGFFNE